MYLCRKKSSAYQQHKTYTHGSSILTTRIINNMDQINYKANRARQIKSVFLYNFQSLSMTYLYIIMKKAPWDKSILYS
jgi:hypothetical protein